MADLGNQLEGVGDGLDRFLDSLDNASIKLGNNAAVEARIARETEKRYKKEGVFKKKMFEAEQRRLKKEIDSKNKIAKLEQENYKQAMALRPLRKRLADSIKSEVKSKVLLLKNIKEEIKDRSVASKNLKGFANNLNTFNKKTLKGLTDGFTKAGKGVAGAASGLWKGMKKILGGIGKAIGSLATGGLLGALILGVKVVADTLLKSDAAMAKLSDRTKMTREELEGVWVAVKGAQNALAQYGFTLEQVTAEAGNLVDQFGAAHFVTKELVETSLQLQKAYGVSAQDAGQLVEVLERAGASSKEFMLNVGARSRKAWVSSGLVMRDLASRSQQISIYTERGRDAMVEMAISAAKAGTDLKAFDGMKSALSDVDAISDNLMNLSVVVGSEFTRNIGTAHELFLASLKGPAERLKIEKDIFKQMQASFKLNSKGDIVKKNGQVLDEIAWEYLNKAYGLEIEYMQRTFRENVRRGKLNKTQRKAEDDAAKARAAEQQRLNHQLERQQTITDRVTKMFSGFYDAFIVQMGEIWGVEGELHDGITGLGDALRKHLDLDNLASDVKAKGWVDAVKDRLSPLWRWIKDKFTAAFGLEDFMENVAAEGGGISGFVSAIADELKPMGDTIFKFLKEGFVKAIEWFGENFEFSALDFAMGGKGFSRKEGTERLEVQEEIAAQERNIAALQMQHYDQRIKSADLEKNKEEELISFKLASQFELRKKISDARRALPAGDEAAKEELKGNIEEWRLRTAEAQVEKQKELERVKERELNIGQKILDNIKEQEDVLNTLLEKEKELNLPTFDDVGFGNTKAYRDVVRKDMMSPNQKEILAGKAGGNALGSVGTRSNLGLVGEAGGEVVTSRSALRSGVGVSGKAASELASIGVPGYYRGDVVRSTVATGGLMGALGSPELKRAQAQAYMDEKKLQTEAMREFWRRYYDKQKEEMGRPGDFYTGDPGAADDAGAPKDKGPGAGEQFGNWVKYLFNNYPGLVDKSLQSGITAAFGETGPVVGEMYKGVFRGMQAWSAGASSKEALRLGVMAGMAESLKEGGTIRGIMDGMRDSNKKLMDAVQPESEKRAAKNLEEAKKLQSENKVKIKEALAAANEKIRANRDAEIEKHKSLQFELMQKKLELEAMRAAYKESGDTESLERIDALLASNEKGFDKIDSNIGKINIATSKLLLTNNKAAREALKADAAQVKELQEVSDNISKIKKDSTLDLTIQRTQAGLMQGFTAGLDTMMATFLSGGSWGDMKKQGLRMGVGMGIKGLTKSFLGEMPDWAKGMVGDASGYTIAGAPGGPGGFAVPDWKKAAGQMAGRYEEGARSEGYGKGDININVGKAAKGKYVNSPTLMMVGEEGRSEVVVPTERIRKGLPINKNVAAELGSIGVPGFAEGGETDWGPGIAGLENDPFSRTGRMADRMGKMGGLKGIGKGSAIGGLMTGADVYMKTGDWKQAGTATLGAGAGIGIGAGLTAIGVPPPLSTMAGQIAGQYIAKGLNTVFGLTGGYGKGRRRTLKTLESHIKSRGMFDFGEPPGLKKWVMRAVGGKEKTPTEKNYNKLKDKLGGSKLLATAGMPTDFWLGLGLGKIEGAEALNAFKAINTNLYGHEAGDKYMRAVAVPQLADGGIVTKPTTAIVGEKGPEMVIPLHEQRQSNDDMIKELKKQNELMLTMIKTQKETGKTEVRLDGRVISETVGENFYDIGIGM